MAFVKLLEVLDVVRGNLDVVNVDALVVGLEGLAAQQLLHGSNSLRSLALSIVQNSAGHVAVGNFVLGSVQSVNTDEVDVLVDGTAGSLNSLQSADSHVIVVAEDNLDLVAELGEVVLADLLTLVTVPVTALQVELLDLNAGIGQSLDGVLGTCLLYTSDAADE